MMADEATIHSQTTQSKEFRRACAENITPAAGLPPSLIITVPCLRRWGPQNWWPAQSRFEVIVGAYLTQNTNWLNVEKAMMNLRKARALSPQAIRELPLERLQELIRPSGYYRQKAIKLKMFVEYLDQQICGIA